MLLVALAAPDAAAPAAVEQTSADRALERLGREIAALEALARDQLPDSTAVAALFEVDLRNDEQVSRRVETLTTSIANDREELAALAASPPMAEARDGGAPGPASDSLEARRLRLRRDELRLAFLSRPREKRLALLDADTSRHRIQAAETAARAARQDARAVELSAEEARGAALDRASQAADGAARAIAGERARVEAARSMLAALQGDLAAAEARRAAEAKRLLAREDALERLLAQDAVDPAAADRAYEELVAVLGAGRDRLRGALADLGRPSGVLPFRTALDLDDRAYSAASLKQELDGMRRAMDQVATLAGTLTASEREARRHRVRAGAGEVARLNELRIRLLRRLDDDKRDRVLGLGDEGIAQLRRELDQLALMTRFHVFERTGQLARLRFGWRELVGGGEVAVFALKLLLVLGLLFFVRWRLVATLRRLRISLRARISQPTARLVVSRWLSFAVNVAPELGMLLLVYLGFAVLVPGRSAERELLRSLMLAYAWYRVILAAVTDLFRGAASSGLVELPPDVAECIFQSVRLVGRYVLGVIVFLVIARRLVGRGYLYHVVVEFSWLMAIPIALVLIRRWRADIDAAYLRAHPTGRLAAAIERQRGRVSGFVFSAAAGGVVAGGGIARYGRNGKQTEPSGVLACPHSSIPCSDCDHICCIGPIV
jgi:hypothetical protein